MSSYCFIAPYKHLDPVTAGVCSVWVSLSGSAAHDTVRPSLPQEARGDVCHLVVAGANVGRKLLSLFHRFQFADMTSSPTLQMHLQLLKIICVFSL